MNYADIKTVDVANGPGIRVSVFVSGCEHYCKNCFNHEAWDFNYGQKFTQETIDKILEYLKPSYIQGLTLLGGEPMHPKNQAQVLELLKQVKEHYPDKSIWMFSGYLFDKEILGEMADNIPETKEILSYLDVMVDGRFIEEEKDLSLRFKGSANQRTICVQESLEKGEVCLYNLSKQKSFQEEEQER